MIQSKIVNGSRTIIYVGGGNYMTQAAPTNFHVFLTSKALVKGESIEDWREVTPAEKAQLEQADAQWVRPPQSFIDEWNIVCDAEPLKAGRYNEGTGYFELNGLKDITYEEAIQIMNIYPRGSFEHATQIYQSFITNQSARDTRCRTYIWPNCQTSNAFMNFRSMFEGQDKMESIQFVAISPYGQDAVVKMFKGCKALKVIKGTFRGGWANDWSNTFEGCESLESMSFDFLRIDLNLSYCPKLNLESFKYMINHCAQEGNMITVKVHADVFAKLTDESNAEWYAVNQAAIAKQISFAAA